MAAFSFQETNFFLAYRLGKTAHDTLQEFIDIDVRAEDLVRILNDNLAYRDLAFRFINKKTAKPEAKKKAPPREAEGDQGTKPPEGAPKEPPSPTYRLIHMLGMLGTRNLILGIRLHKLVHGCFPFSPEGEVDVTPSQLLKRALAAEDLFTRNRLDYSETAFACAAVFDLGERQLAKVMPAKRAEPFALKTWERAQRTGLIAYSLAARIPGFPQKQALAAGLFAPLGRLLLARRFPDGKQAYPELDAVLDDDKLLTPQARALRERSIFGAAQEELGAHALRYLRLFPELVPVIRNHREPYCLKGVDRENYRFALLIWLASSMARSWKIPADDKDPIFHEWATPGLEALKIPKSTLIVAMKEAMTLK